MSDDTPTIPYKRTRPPAKGKRSQARELKGMLRRERAMQLRITGMALRKIADQLTTEGYKCTYITVRNDILKAVQDRVVPEQELVRELQAVHKERYDALFRSAYPQALAPPTDVVMVGGKLITYPDGTPVERKNYKAQHDARDDALKILKQEADLFGINTLDRVQADAKFYNAETYRYFITNLLEKIGRGDEQLRDEIFADFLAFAGRGGSIIEGESAEGSDVLYLEAGGADTDT